MARFAASQGSAQFTDPAQFSVRSGGGFGAAAGMTDVAGILAGNRERAPKFDNMTGEMIKNRAQERITNIQAEGMIKQQGLASMAQVESAKIAAKAAEKAASLQASASKQGSMMSGIGSIIGAGIGLLSDETTKEHVKSIDDALETLRSLRPVTFHYTEEWSTTPERMHHGFIAQEYREVLPDATYYDGSVDKFCIDTSDLIGLLVRAVQQLETRVQYLEATKALEGVK